MKIELYIYDEKKGEKVKKLFTTPYVPNLVKRKYFEVMAKSEEKIKESETRTLSFQEQLDEEDELVGILADVAFNGQFTAEQVHEGAENDYIYEKLAEAVFGKKKENEGEEGNKQGK